MLKGALNKGHNLTLPLTHTSTATSQSDSFLSVERMMWGARK